MSHMRQIIITPPGTRPTDDYLRSSAVRQQEGFDLVREHQNTHDAWEAIRFTSEKATNGTYAIGIVHANRRISGVGVGLRAGTATLEILRGPTGSEVALTWQKVAPTNLLAVTTTPTFYIPDTPNQVIEAPDWMIMIITAAAATTFMSVVLTVD